MLKLFRGLLSFDDVVLHVVFDYDIFVVDLATGIQTPLTDTEGKDYLPRFSPNGQHIVFVSDRNGGDSIWMMNADGSEPVQLSQDVGKVWFPTWSPDSEQIVFISDRNGVSEAFVVNVNEPKQEQGTNVAVRDS